MEDRAFYLRRLGLPTTCQRPDADLVRAYEAATLPCAGCKAIKARCGGGPPPTLNGELANVFGRVRRA